MESEGEKSKADIIKKFGLPERKSKIGTTLKMHVKYPEYCICHSTDTSRFMICCEKCDVWYHGDCIGLTEKECIYMEKWFCNDCIEKYGLEIVYYPFKRKCSSGKRKKKKKKQVSYKHEHSKATGLPCGQCSNCLQRKGCVNKNYTFPEKRRKCGDKQAYKVSTKINTSENSAMVNKERRDVDGSWHLSNLEQKSCIGPNCTNLARMNSKYCSDKCGIALASLRIITILPKHVTEREKIPCVADQLDRAKLDKVRLQKKFALEELNKLNRKEKKLLNLISKAKRVPVMEVNEDEEGKIYCVTCGWEISSRSAVKHMEICFKKYESQTAVFGKYKSNPAFGNIICDYYDSANKTYCKRLRYVCPKHFKPKQAEDNEVCGCPVIQTISHNILSAGQKYCQQPKKKCDQHYNWEILNLAEIDLERFRKLNKINKLIEEEANILRQITNRTGALGILVHNTKVHDANF